MGGNERCGFAQGSGGGAELGVPREVPGVGRWVLALALVRMRRKS